MKEKRFLEYYKKMLLIRYFEEGALSFFNIGKNTKIFGTIHVCIGEEAIAVGACEALRKDDYITSTHRGHGHFIAKGGDPKRIMAELFGKETGYSKGRGGTQHMGDMTIGHIGSNGITAGNIPIATGAGFSIRYRGTDQVVVCFFGDGAVNEGVFHESLNMAAIWKLPIIYVCENNLYAMSTPVATAFPLADIAERAKSYNIEGVFADGMDVLDVKEKIGSAVQKARSGKGPTLIECKTYRFTGHSPNDKCVYRTREEEREWKKKDPIILLGNMMVEKDICTKDELSEIEAETKEIISEAVRYAEDSEWPSSKELYRDVYFGNE